MEAWAQYCAASCADNDVVPLRRRLQPEHNTTGLNAQKDHERSRRFRKQAYAAQSKGARRLRKCCGGCRQLRACSGADGPLSRRRAGKLLKSLAPLLFAPHRLLAKTSGSLVIFLRIRPVVLCSGCQPAWQRTNVVVSAGGCRNIEPMPPSAAAFVEQIAGSVAASTAFPRS